MSEPLEHDRRLIAAQIEAIEQYRAELERLRATIARVESLRDRPYREGYDMTREQYAAVTVMLTAALEEPTTDAVHLHLEATGEIYEVPGRVEDCPSEYCRRDVEKRTGPPSDKPLGDDLIFLSHERRITGP